MKYSIEVIRQNNHIAVVLRDEGLGFVWMEFTEISPSAAYAEKLAAEITSTNLCLMAHREMRLNVHQGLQKGVL